jgi:type II secretory pathway component PulF
MDKKRRAWLRIAFFGDKPRGEFLGNLAGLVSAGIPIYDALTVMAKAYGKEGDSRARIMADIAGRLEEGVNAADAMRPWLAAHETMILASSARGVELGEALRNAAHLTENRRRIVGAIAGAMAYPAILLAIGAVMMWVFAAKVIPTLGKLISAEHWHGLGAFYYALSAQLQSHGPFILPVALASAAIAVRSLARWPPDGLRAWLDRRLPPWNLYQVYQGAILLISLSIMMRSGIPMYDAVNIVRNNHPRNAWLKTRLDGIRRKLEEGAGVRLAALDSPVFHRDVRIAVALFDRFSEPDKAMERLGIQAGESAEKSAKRIGAVANFVVLALVGGLVGGVIPAVMSVAMEFFNQTAGR